MLTANEDYAWIQTFIDYLKEIIDMIMKLFKGSDDTTPTAPAEDETT